MDKIRDIARAIKLYPRIKMGERTLGGAVQGTGPHKVKFMEEPTVITGKDKKGNPRKELKFILQEHGQLYRWQVPILNEEGQPNYLVERLMDIEVGDIRVLEMKKRGPRNYVDVMDPSGPTEQEVTDKFTEMERQQVGDVEEGVGDITDNPPF